MYCTFAVTGNLTLTLLKGYLKRAGTFTWHTFNLPPHLSATLAEKEVFPSTWTEQLEDASTAPAREMWGGGVYSVVHGRGYVTIDPHIPPVPGRSTSGFNQPGRHCFHRARSAMTSSVSRINGELPPSKNLS